MKIDKKELARKKAKLRAQQVKSTGSGPHSEDEKSRKRKARRLIKRIIKGGDYESLYAIS